MHFVVGAVGDFEGEVGEYAGCAEPVAGQWGMGVKMGCAHLCMYSAGSSIAAMGRFDGVCRIKAVDMIV